MPKLCNTTTLEEAVKLSFDGEIGRVSELDKPTPYKTVGIVGAGLIGGSFALALKRAGLAERIIAAGRKENNLQEAKALDIIDEIVSLETLAAESDFIYLAVPVKAFKSVFEQLLPSLSEDALISDGGSTKYELIADARELMGARIQQFVPAHPIAGSHQSGAAAARADLYEDRKLIITPLEENSLQDVQRLAATWQAIGASVYCMDAHLHDKIFAATSHFPHLIGAAYVNSLIAAEDGELFFNMAGTGFQDFTRIVASSPEMWNDIFFANKEAMIEQIDGMQQQLADARASLAQDEQSQLFDWFKQASDKRKYWQLKS